MMKSIHVHMTAGYIVNTETDGLLRKETQVTKALSLGRMDLYLLMALYRTLAWEVLRAFSLIEMSCLVEVTRLVKVLCLRKYHVEKRISMKKFTKLHKKYGVVPRVDMRVKIKL